MNNLALMLLALLLLLITHTKVDCFSITKTLLNKLPTIKNIDTNDRSNIVTLSAASKSLAPIKDPSTTPPYK